MCLIITGNANKVRTTLLAIPGLLKDIYDSNKDGIGTMYASDDGIVVVNKLVPTNFEEAKAFIETLPDSERELALHFRMRTHGDIDLTNCHPYPILEGAMHMMHNGVIHGIDDKSDKTKSDTWHYIEQILKPQLSVAPQLMTLPSWLYLVGEDIGSNNRFVFLDKEGNLVIVNKKTGIEHDGMWFSNTYAWSPEMLIPDYRGGVRGYYSGWRGWGDDDEVGYSAYWDRTYGSTGTFPKSGSKTTPMQPMVKADDVWEAVNGGDADAVYKFLDQFPISTLMVLFKTDQFVCSVEHNQLSQQDAKIVQMVEAADEPKLAQYCRKSAGRCRKVAEVIAWYGYWYSKQELQQGEQKEAPATTEDEADFDVVEGQVVPRKSTPPDIVDEANPDDADLNSWRADFQKWLDRQQAGLAGESRQPAKWTAQTPALLTAPQPPAQVAPIKSRTVMYRGYRIEVPMALFENGQWGALREHLDKEALRLHDAELAKRETLQPDTTVGAFSQKDSAHIDAEASNEVFAG